MMLKRDWWKFLGAGLLLYAIIVGFFVDIPDTMIQETMRNLFYHVGMWFAMLSMLIVGFIYSLRYLRKFDEREDVVAVEAVNVGLLFGFLGIFSGMVWANFTWGSPWVKDPKLNGAAVGLFIYLAYMILRGSIDDVHKRAKVGAVYNIFAFVLWIVFVLIMPRLAAESIHPGKTDSPVIPCTCTQVCGWSFTRPCWAGFYSHPGYFNSESESVSFKKHSKTKINF